VRSVSILGILGVAMGLVVIGRGIDLSAGGADGGVPSPWTLHLAASGIPLPLALTLGLAFSLAVGAFQRLAGGLCGKSRRSSRRWPWETLIYGFGRYFLFGLDVVYIADAARPLLWLGQGTIQGVPVPIFLFAAVLPRRFGCFLRYSRTGRYLRAVGDNLLAARITGRSDAAGRRAAIRHLLADRLHGGGS
jgi:ribose transport system permease protein